MNGIVCYDGDLFELSGPGSVGHSIKVAGTSLSNDRCTCRCLGGSREGIGK